ncbi:hypothetical protein EGW08_005280 [Elysia chlorotica]|uniref:Autophagy-related protein n=1 Tax=Elysia chlorotica TaxID=188477 RepID=A0A3S1HVL5_ELYCH|nr:hypothetical protein EGW08_005280 [Elysia chlorotica]
MKGGARSLRTPCLSLREEKEGKHGVIVSKNPLSDIYDIDKTHYLVPGAMTVAQFIYIIRQHIQWPVERPLFLFVGRAVHVPAATFTIGEVYQEYKNEDGFLHVVYSGENAFYH